MIFSTPLSRRLAGAALGLVTFCLLFPYFGGSNILSSQELSSPQGIPLPPPTSSSSPRGRPLSAGNATLGFQTIQVINLARRHDRADAIVLQSTVSNISLHITDGVDIADINEGMPPNSSPGRLKDSEKACFRAHANLWRRMLSEKWSSALIMEADAAWDVDVRAITLRLSHALNDLIDAHPRSTSTAKPSEQDPYNVAKWDMLSLGQCHENQKHSEESLIYPDISAPLNMSYYGRPLNDERAVRRSGGIVCTTAYALSPRGALKLLLKFNVDMTIPLDLAIRSMIEADELIVYSVQPSVIAQWIYRAGSGSEGANSDVSPNSKGAAATGDHEETWRDIHSSLNVWTLKPYHEDARFRNGALQALGRMAFGDDVVGGREGMV